MSNNVTVYGRIGKEPELSMAGQTPLLKFSLGDGVGYGDKKTTNWWACALFGTRANTLADMLNKGDAVAVTGEIVLREWEKEGVKRLSPELRVNDVWLLGSKKDSAPQSAAYQQTRPQAYPQGDSKRRPPAEVQQAAVFDDDLPF